MAAPERRRFVGTAIRATAGGILMGLANLVPGISGGTMLVATGVYTRFVEAIAELTTLRFRPRPMLLLAVVGGAALLSILLLAGPVKGLVEGHRWAAYSFFIGLTLGGGPIVWRMARPGSAAFAVGGLGGVAVMAVVSFVPPEGGGDGGWLLLFVAGVLGASAMILPGISGAYLLLVLGQYERILGAVDRAKHGEFGAAAEVLLPAGLGIALGIVGVCHLIRWTLRRYEQATLGVLLGLVVGSVLGLWPFRDAPPTVARGAGALLLVLLGLAATLGIDRLGRRAG